VVNVTQEDLRGAHVIHSILTSLKQQTVSTGTVHVPRRNAQVFVNTQYITGLTIFHTVPRRGQLAMAQIRRRVLGMSDLCLTSILSISPCGFPSATAKLGV